MTNGDPRNDSEVRSLDEALALHNTPALVQGSKDSVAHYISGFVDGEGCFCVSFQPSKRHRFGWEVRPSFSVSQNADRAELLHVIQREWKCGFIRPDRSDKTLKYEVRQVRDLTERVLLHFQNYPLRSSKQDDVMRFERICRLVSEGAHLTDEGFREIVQIAMQMNPSGKRKYSGSDILNSLRPGERIVYATSNRGRT